MNPSRSNADTEFPTDGATESFAKRIQAELEEVFRSTPFRSSKQSQQLLRYISEATLAGRSELLKERVIGVEVFGRTANYNTSDDPIVRSRATDVRKRLAQYYLGEGAGASIRIEISPGGYHATFTAQGAPESASTQSGPIDVLPAAPSLPQDAPSAPETAEATRLDPPTAAARHRFRRWWYLAAIATLLISIGGAAYWFLCQSAIHRFWQPVLGKHSVYIYTGVIPAGNPVITMGDLFASVKVATLLSTERQSFDIRSGDDITFNDLRQSPSVLIGGFNNRWTLLLNEDVQFLFVADKGLLIEERTGTHRRWGPVYSPAGKLTADYAVITRLVSSRMGQPVIAIAGVTDTGTRAAAEFVASPEGMEQLAKAAPRDWQKKNLQFILQTSIVNNTPSTLTIVAIRTW